MVFALAGDSTTTTFMNSSLQSLSRPARRQRGRHSAIRIGDQGDTAARMAFEAPGQLQFEQDRLHQRGRHLASPDHFVNRYRSRPQQLRDGLARRSELLVGRRPGRRAWEFRAFRLLDRRA